MDPRIFRDTAVLQEILQWCRSTVLSLDLILFMQAVIMHNFSSIHCEMDASVQRFCSAAWHIAVLQGHSFDPTLNPFHLESQNVIFGGWGGPPWVVGCGGVDGFECITEFKPKPYLALAGIWLGWGCDNRLIYDMQKGTNVRSSSALNSRYSLR